MKATVHLLVTVLAISFTGSTKIMDYDNVDENPYYRKSNLDFLIKRFCNFLQIKTTSSPAPHTQKPKFSDKLMTVFENLGMPVKTKDDLPDQVIEGLLGFIKGAHPEHEFNKRNMTDDERTKLRDLLPGLIEHMEAEDGGDVYDR